ncbi:hypothetical protein ACQPW1_10290 [Nocardia sp. CA-128927]|uniref:hypothetical protein n=1 Tax=Nocardia sp. CA-128927 TaxID=3239975 RepID=UPI003D96CDF8
MCRDNAHLTHIAEPDIATVLRWLDDKYKPERLNREIGLRELIGESRVDDLRGHGYSLISHHDSRSGCAEYITSDPARMPNWIAPRCVIPLSDTSDSDDWKLVADWARLRMGGERTPTAWDPWEEPNVGDWFLYRGGVGFRFGGYGLAGNYVLAVDPTNFEITLPDREMDWSGMGFDPEGKGEISIAYAADQVRAGEGWIHRGNGSRREKVRFRVPTRVWRIRAAAPTNPETFVYGGDQS